MKNQIFNKITPDEALDILNTLAKSDKELKKKIIDLAEAIFTDVDFDDVCENVFHALDGIDVHELWDRAGPRTDGYTSPEEMAVEMFEEALEPFFLDMHRLLDLKMNQEAMLCCMGIAKGIYEYEENSTSEFKEWATDIPGEMYGFVIREWKERGITAKDRKKMRSFVQKECPNWSKWAIDQI
jgi:hypothetical protein